MKNNFYIVRILSRDEFITNIGRNNASKGDKFQIFNHEDDEIIIDPITNEEIGNFIKSKAVIELTEVHEKYSVAKIESEEIDLDPILTLGTAASSLRKSVKFNQTADVYEHDIDPIEKTTKSPIRVGDLLRKVV